MAEALANMASNKEARGRKRSSDKRNAIIEGSGLLAVFVKGQSHPPTLGNLGAAIPNFIKY